MTVIEETRNCDKCEMELIDGECLNVNCTTAHETSTADASRKTAKQHVEGVRARAETRPRAWNITGGVD